MSAAVASVSFRHGAMPWGATPDDEERFRRISQRVLLVCFALAVALPWLPVFKPEVPERATLPPPAARLILDPVPVPVPVLPLRTPPAQAAPAPAAKPAPVQADVSVSKPALAQARPDPSKARPVTEARNPQADKPPGEALDAARRKASGVGLLAMKNELAELHGAPVAVQLRSDIKPGPGVGTGSGVGVGAGTDAGAPARALITSNASNGSGGINTAAYSSNTGGGGLAGRSTTLVDGVAGGGGGGGAGVGGGGKGNGFGTGGSGGGGGGIAKGGSVQRSGSGKASRSIEDIKLVFERNKGAIYALYNRALRDEPALHGKVVLELRIAPSGEVVDCRIASSELHAVELERKLLARIRQFDFGAKDVEQMVVSWPVDFLPS